MRINLRVWQSLLVNPYHRRNQAIYQKRKQCTYTLFLVHLPYSTNKAIRIQVFYLPWRQPCIIWMMDMCQNISSGVRKSLFWKLRIKVECTSAMIFLWNITKKNQKNSIIVLRNGIHQLNMIYFGISLLIQLCVCYQTRGTRPVILLQFAVNGYLILILRWRFHLHRTA